MIVGIICGAMAGAMCAAIVTKKMCLRFIEKLDELETQHREELLKVSKKAINRP